MMQRRTHGLAVLATIGLVGCATGKGATHVQYAALCLGQASS